MPPEGEHVVEVRGKVKQREMCSTKTRSESGIPLTFEVTMIARAAGAPGGLPWTPLKHPIGPVAR